MDIKYSVGTNSEFQAILNANYEWWPAYRDCTLKSPAISPPFQTGSNKECMWRLICTRDLHAIHIVYLQLIGSKYFQVEAKCTFHIISGRGEKILQEHNITRYFYNGDYVKIFELPRFATSDGNSFHISCKIFSYQSTLVRKINIHPALEILKIQVELWPQGINVLELLTSKESADLKIVTAEKKYLFASKAVLSSHSPVFTAMFEHGMKEKKEDVVEIDDCKYEVVKEMLRYVYFGEVENLDTIAMELTRVSHRYELKGLLAKCALHLYDTLMEENYIEVLILADTLQMEELKELTVNFISKLQNDTQEQEAADSS